MKSPIYISQDRKYKPVNITIFVIVCAVIMGLFVLINETIIKPSKEKQKIEYKERYFIVTYQFSDNSQIRTGQVNITSSNSVFMSRSKLTEWIEKDLNRMGEENKDILITFILELSKDEFNA